ncbi:ATP-binding protein [Acidaminococcus massiliensis]|uniref:ATP-binding protein n=1 Tax=Acidaminococcus massiliensis TaxID=1852375 RepID=UPI00266BE8FE|nr:ATP-binding protein [Acidaminococcus massiliensis]
MERKIIEALKGWKDSHRRLPLLVSGARQVGKTYILREFGAECFESMVYINLETNRRAAACFEEDLSPRQVLPYLEAVTGQRVIPGKTLLILDEIQSAERALTSLKYFAEEAPEIHVAAAGSLLGVALNRNRYSFPVGKVETLQLFPMDFEEFLWARERKQLAQAIRRNYEKMQPLPLGLHQEAIRLYREYLVMGGMPAVVNGFLQTGSFLDVPPLQQEILDNYTADMAKYATPSETVKIRACYQSLPVQLAKENKKFQYKVVQKGGSSAIFGAPIEWLSQAGIVLRCQRLNHAAEPVAAYTDLSAFKLYGSDVGLLTAQAGLSPETILSGAGNLFMGAVTENYVAQQLAVAGLPLYYWESRSTAEVDFVLPVQSRIYGVEVKKGEHTRSRSLGVFLEQEHPTGAIRLSLKNFGCENGIRSVPLYAAFCLPEGL